MFEVEIKPDQAPKIAGSYNDMLACLVAYQLGISQSSTPTPHPNENNKNQNPPESSDSSLHTSQVS